MYIENNIVKLKTNKFITLNLEIYYLLKINKDYRKLATDWSYVCDSRIIQYYLKIFKGREVVLNQGHRLIFKMLDSGMSKYLFLGSNTENLNLSADMVRKINNRAEVEIDHLPTLNKLALNEFAKQLEAKYHLDNFDAVFVALGAPKQDMLIAKLNTTSLIFGCGGTFEFMSGKVSYPPKLVEYLGLTFLWRLIKDFSKRRLLKISYTFRGALLLLVERDIN